AKEMDDFLSPRLVRLTPPKNWPFIPEAAKLLVDAILQGKKLVIWGDYDVDGITSTALCLDVLEYHGFKPYYHLPHRIEEGYGLNIPGIENLAAKGYTVLLTVDCGISNNACIERAKELGMTVIITDHHLPPKEYPAADIICNPKTLPPEQVPFADLAGVGVAFFLMAQVNQLLSHCFRTKPFRMDNVLDLVALGTLADMMPLTGENRLLVAGGLKHIAHAHRLGLAALKMISGANIATEMKSVTVSFKLAPRLNAAGRIENAALALELLRSQDRETAYNLAEQLDILNKRRREEEEQILQEAREQAQSQVEAGRLSLVLYKQNWHAGIIGIVASHIVEEFARPTFILCQGKDCLKGSGRSFGDIDLHDLLTKVAEYLRTYGGHKAAAALTLEEKNLDAFSQAFEQATRAIVQEKKLKHTLILDGELSLAQAYCAETLNEIALLEPFGQGNPEPIFSSPPLLVERHDYLGFERKHILLRVREIVSGMRMTAKGWRLAKTYQPPLLAGKTLRLAYILRLNTFRGLPQPELEIKDISLLPSKQHTINSWAERESS
ncbi:MAG: single-stranded-DNA-specific exonuclease RecJ, partial [Desulfovibrio sp.]|nr:single-stranded-DNA-specific exonuclease RecJ [Desulfovibrio sp.]